MKVSIITVCYNSEKTIKDTIDSVLEQDYADIEYLIIDGKSSDGSLELIKSYGNRIDQLVSEKDQGMYDALNKGIQMAQGDLIGILNSDDFYTDETVISHVVAQMQAADADALYADLHYVDAKDISIIKRYWKSGKYKAGKFLKGWMPPHPTFFLKKSAYEKYGGFNLSLKSAADYELMLRMIHKEKVQLTYLPQVIVKMRMGGMSNSSLINRLLANKEDQKAWKINGLKPHPLTFLYKPMRKIIQFLLK
jgi:glycosyltransferase involved in cell wall biosynthesis